MSLYLAVFSGETEIDGVEVGRYSDFDAFRTTVINRLEGGQPGSRFPNLILHSDCDGSWSVEEAAELDAELQDIKSELSKLRPISFEPGTWQAALAKSLGLVPRTLEECFFDVDGEPLIDRLRALASISRTEGLPILFQ